MTDKEIIIDTVLSLVQSGLTLEESITRLSLDNQASMIKKAIRKDKRYIEYRQEQKKQIESVSKDIMRMYDAGVTYSNISKEMNMPKSSVCSVISRSKPVGRSTFERIVISAVTLRDVEMFKEIISEGEELCCDITDYGTREICVVEAKYPHFAKTDKGGIPWSWLTVMNRERIGK